MNDNYLLFDVEDDEFTFGQLHFDVSSDCNVTPNFRPLGQHFSIPPLNSQKISILKDFSNKESLKLSDLTVDGADNSGLWKEVFSNKRMGKIGQYDDFETINWVRDMAKDRIRQFDVCHKSLGTYSQMFYSNLDAACGWFCVFLVGIFVGIFAGTIDIATGWFSDLKIGFCSYRIWLNREQCCWSQNMTSNFSHCDQWFDWSQLWFDANVSASTNKDARAYVLGYVFFVLVGGLLAFICANLVKTFAPYACGSGIPEIKTILSGFIIRGYLGKWTVVIKSIGMVLAVASGLSLGKEGPLVHVACCVGNIFGHLFPKYAQNEAKKREILSASAAAGVAVAFGAPIGGVLFSLEEASYYFPLKTMFRSFFCAMAADYTLRFINPFGNEHLVMFQVDYRKSPWHTFELIPFAILGILGGLLGSIFIRLNIYICRKRKNSSLGHYPIAEVLIVALATLLLSYPCEYLRIDSGELIKILVNLCGPDDEKYLCNYYRVNTSSSRASDADSSVNVDGQLNWAILNLLYALLVKMVLTVFTFGLKVPAGIFIPSMAVGGIIGRILGILVEQFALRHRTMFLFNYICTADNVCINPGLYAMVGAAAVLGGVTRMTISLVVIMLELTGGSEYILPLMVAAMVSKWTGDRLTSGGIYDEHIKLNDYPFLTMDGEYKRGTMAEHVMQPPSQTCSVPRHENGVVTQAMSLATDIKVVTQSSMTVNELESLVIQTKFYGFPIVVSHQSLYIVGFVSRKDLVLALDRSRREDDAIVSDSIVYFTESVPTALQAFVGPKPLCLHHIVDMCPVTVADKTPMDTVIDFFIKLGLRQLLVSRTGRLLGIITKKDVLRYLKQLKSLKSRSTIPS